MDDAPEAVVTKTLGAIVGVVVDETITPIPGAKVSVAEQETEANENGEFVVNEVEGGLHAVTVQADGFLPIKVETAVTNGEIAKVRIVMEADRRVEPFHDSIRFDGFMEAHAGPATAVLVAIAPDLAGCKCTFEHEPQPGARTFVLEAFGQPSMGSNPLPVYGDVFWEFFAQDNPDTEDDETAGASDHADYPVNAQIPAGGFAFTVDKFTVRLTGGNWIHAQESYELILTTFYHEDAPAGWSITDES